MRFVGRIQSLGLRVGLSGVECRMMSGPPPMRCRDRESRARPVAAADI
jgi:hypothetical protein